MSWTVDMIPKHPTQTNKAHFAPNESFALVQNDVHLPDPASASSEVTKLLSFLERVLAGYFPQRSTDHCLDPYPQARYINCR